MSTEPWPTGYDLIHLDTVDSTSSEAARRAPTLAGPTWIVADTQTAARGRRGRAWAAPEGNFNATLVMRPQAGADQVALRSFVASLALYDAFVAVTGRPEAFALKWPNDVLLNGGKVAGILLESVGVGGVPDHLAIGIGVNLMHAPHRTQVEPQALTPVSLMDETGAAVTPGEFIALLAPAFAAYERQLTTYGFGPIREAWLARAARLGEVITARTGADETTGVFDTVDATGQLVLSTPKGPRRIAAADVFF